MSFFHAFGLPVTIARPFNTYGPRQSARAVIPSTIIQILSGVKEIKLGDLTPTRDFNFVKDTCRGFLFLAKCDAAIGEVVNIGSNQEVSIQKTLDIIKEIIGSSVNVTLDNQRLRPPSSEVRRLWCDNTKIKKLTGFQPQFSFEEGLRETINWFRDPNHLKRYKAFIYNI